MSNRAAFCAIVLGMAMTGFAEDAGENSASPSVDPAVIQKAGQLQAAAKLLRAAGKREVADELMNEASELVRPVLTALKEKRSHIAKLNEEVTALEKLLESPAEIRFQVHVYRLPQKLWQSVKPGALSDQPGQVVTVEEEWLHDFAELRNDQEPIALQWEPSLTAKSGVAAKVASGGEFPVPVPNEDGTIAIRWQEFGNFFEVVPTVRGLGAVDLTLSLEHSERVDELAVELNGIKIPGLNKRKIHVKTQAQLNETVLIQAFELEDDVLIYLITPEHADKKRHSVRQKARNDDHGAFGLT